MNVKRMYNEILLTSLFINFVDSLLTGFALFSLTYVLIYFTRLNYIISVILGGSFFVFSLYRKIRLNKILVLEQKYPQLRERLRTSFDYKDRSNRVINELHADIMALIKKADANAYLNQRVLIIKVFTIGISLSIVVLLAGIGFDVSDVASAIVQSAPYKVVAGAIGDLTGETRDINPKDQLDQARLLELGNQEKNISITTFNTELDVNSIAPPKKNDFGGQYPEEIAGEATSSYQEEIPPEHKETVKRYFQSINK